MHSPREQPVHGATPLFAHVHWKAARELGDGREQTQEALAAGFAEEPLSLEIAYRSGGDPAHKPVAERGPRRL